MSICLAADLYKTCPNFPIEEKFGLVSQLKRSSSSISTNIAEGVSRFTDKEKARYIEIAYGSTIEVMSHLLLAKELKFINDEELTVYRININELTNKLNSFYQNIKKEK